VADPDPIECPQAPDPQGSVPVRCPPGGRRLRGPASV